MPYDDREKPVLELIEVLSLQFDKSLVSDWENSPYHGP